MTGWLGGQVLISPNASETFCEVLSELSPASIALSGGSTAARCYQSLANAGLPPALRRVYFSDERFVPITDPDSNEGLARKTLPLDDLEVFSMRGKSSDVDQAADEYDEMIESHPPIDVVHLGIGPDGHTASLFPYDPEIKTIDRWVISTGDASHAHQRITFTFSGISRCKTAVVTVVGPEKRAAMASLRDGEDLPARHISAEKVIWIVDELAFPA